MQAAKLLENEKNLQFLLIGSTANYQLPIELISFGTAKKYSSLIKGQKIIVVYSIEIDRWNGYEKLRGKIVSIL